MTSPHMLLLEGDLTPDHTLTYVHLPFVVPPNTTRLEVRYSYDAAISSDPSETGGNTLDIGIFDARGVDFLKAGFRGWSGSARDRFFIALDDATPGYMPGPIQSGTWHICLGAYKVAAGGCHYRVDIHLTTAEAVPVVGFPPRLTLSATPTTQPRADGWYRGELHCHTVNSDGDSTVAEIVARAEALGLDFLAITDHNNLTHQVDMARIDTPLLLIPGVEVTTYYGHWNIWGASAWIDFRVQSPDDLARAIAAAADAGYLVSCNHPRPYGPDWAFPEVGGYACVEVWNGPWQFLNTSCLSFWEARLASGERLTAVGGSDHHFSHREHPAQLGQPTIYVYSPAPPSPVDVLDALRAGRAFITEAPEGPRVWITAGAAQMGDLLPRTAEDRLTLTAHVKGGAGARLEICGAGGVLLTQDIRSDDEVLTLSAGLRGSPYARAQLVDPADGRVRALTNPLYVR